MDGLSGQQSDIRVAGSSSSEPEMCIEERAPWTSLGGHMGSSRRRPTNWRPNPSGSWDRRDLMPFGQASSVYRAKYFRCAACADRLLPTNIEYRFGCVGCGLVFGWSFGGLWGYPHGHERAMHLTLSPADDSEL